MTIHLHQQMSAGNLKDNETIFILPEMQMRKLNIFTCIQMCTTWSRGFLTSQPTVMKFSQKTENELFNTIWKSFSSKGDTHFCCITQRTLLGGQRLWGDFVVVFFPFVYFFGLFFFLWFSCQINYTDNKAFWIFLFLVTKIKIQKLNGTQFLRTGVILFLILQSWNVLVAFSR